VGKGKCKGKLNTFKNNRLVNLPLLLPGLGWAKAGKMQDRIFGGFFVLRVGVLRLQKFTHRLIISMVFVSSLRSVVHPEGLMFAKA